MNTQLIERRIDASVNKIGNLIVCTVQMDCSMMGFYDIRLMNESSRMREISIIPIHALQSYFGVLWPIAAYSRDLKLTEYLRNAILFRKICIRGRNEKQKAKFCSQSDGCWHDWCSRCIWIFVKMTFSNWGWKCELIEDIINISMNALANYPVVGRYW